jgi:hypothetical protein
MMTVGILDVEFIDIIDPIKFDNTRVCNLLEKV